MKDFSIDLAVRNLIWLVVFITICAIGTSYMLIPKMKEYQKQAIESKKARIGLNRIKEDYQAVESVLQNTILQHYTALNNLHNEPSEEKLQAFMQDRFIGVDLKKINTSEEDNILSTTYQITGYANDTKDLADFANEINNMPYFVRIDFPIKMELDEKSKYIYFAMLMSIKNTTYKEHQIILENNLRFDNFRP